MKKVHLPTEYRKQLNPVFFVDIGGLKPVVGKKSLNRILTESGEFRPPQLRKSENRFRFGDQSFSSVGKVTVRSETPTGIEPIAVDVDIVTADILPLLGLDILDREGLTTGVA